ncbi:MAG TPA: DUF1932 domain-containing protein [Ktedonosporobacter sp.]|nr:DUF1932 domain-containing protein [Ktedonosporobacter sp.]
MPTIGILSPGDMGHAIGATLRRHGLRVLTNLQGRSARTVALSARVGIEDVADDQRLVREAEILLSILVPEQASGCAERIAAALHTTGSRVLYVDCNAIAPCTVQSIEHILTDAGADVVDGGIIGSPPEPGSAGPRFYASGPSVQQFALLKEYGLDIRVLGSQVGQASGLKMCYASLTKGLTALASEALTAGEALGLTTVLTQELRESQPALLQWLSRQVPRMPPKAGRWVSEMEEIAATFADLGLPPQMLEGAAAMYRLVGQTELAHETPEVRKLGQSLDEVISLLAAALKKDDAQS